MRRALILITLLLGLIGFVESVNIGYPIKVFAGEKQKIENEVIPTEVLMKGLAARAQNLFEGIMAGDFKVIQQEAVGIQEESRKIEEYFFPVHPAIDAWLRRSKALDPAIPEAVEKLKSHFGIYIRRLVRSADEIQIASDSKDAEAAFTTYMSMARACFDCHNRYSSNK